MIHIDPQVMFIILYFGEVEFSKCIESIYQKISFKKIVKCIAYKSIFDAHKECYDIFTSSNCDILVKVDGDMIFINDISHFIIEFINKKDHEHWAIDVHDHYTNSMIPALHMYKNTFVFKDYDQYNPDKFSAPVDKWITHDNSITHGQLKDNFQAFRTGFYRGQKLNSRSGGFILEYLERAKDNYWIQKGAEAGLNFLGKDIVYSHQDIFNSYTEAVKSFYTNA